MGKQELALLIPILVVSFVGLTVLARTVLGSAASRRIGERHGVEDARRIDDLEQEVGLLRQELSEMHERLDFTERLLARGQREETPHA